MTLKPVIRAAFSALSLLIAFSVLAFQHIENQQQSNEKQIQNGVNVVELFTSQGCSSCPPADALLSKIKNDKNVIALSYHVDYWDYLGWKDPYSSKEFSNYQRVYASRLNSGVYTPQMVVNGSTEFVGSRESTLNRSIMNKSTVVGLTAPEISRNRNSLDFTYSLKDAPQFDKAYALLLMDEKTTSISRGENARKKLKNTNVVLQRVALDRNTTTGKTSFKIPENEANAYRVAIVAQDKNLKMVAAGISSLE